MLPSVNLTSINSSSSLRVIACIPVFLILEYSDNFVFLINPLLVAISTYNESSLKSVTGITAVTFSPWANCNKLTIAVPLAVLLASGNSYVFNLNTLPVFVKNIKLLCVEVTKRCSTKSSSRVFIAVRPFPPRFWLL